MRPFDKPYKAIRQKLTSSGKGRLAALLLFAFPPELLQGAVEEAAQEAAADEQQLPQEQEHRIGHENIEHIFTSRRLAAL